MVKNIFFKNISKMINKNKMPVEIKGRDNYLVEIHVPDDFSHVTKKFQSKETEIIIRPALAKYFPVSSLYYYEVKNSITNKNLSSDYICVQINSVINYDNFENIQNLLQNGKYYVNEKNIKSLTIEIEPIEIAQVYRKYEVSIKPEIEKIIKDIKNIDPNFNEMNLIFTGTPNFSSYNENFVDFHELNENDTREFKDFKYGFMKKLCIIYDPIKGTLNLAFRLTDYSNNKEIFDKVFDLLN
jgi:hypothetical protein